MKRSAIVILLLLAVVTVSAIPVRRGVSRAIRLADGTTVVAEACGDEHCHYFQSSDGRYFLADVEADAKGAIYKEVSSLVIESLRTQAADELVQSQSRAAKKRIILGANHDEYSGTKRCLVILANFADVKFKESNDIDYYKSLVNDENFTDEYGNTHSVRDYYYAQSNGQFTIDFDVAGPIEMQYGYAYYGQNSGYTTDANAYQMVIEACQGAHDQGFDFSNYDWDGDGKVDQVFVLYAGNNEASSYQSDQIWPHMNYLSSFNATLTFDGVTIDTYACSSELIINNYEVETNNGIGPMCHEFSHTLGLPDAYPTDGGTNYGMSNWSIMDQGLYNGGNCGYLPCGFTAYERMYCGWINPVEFGDEEDITITGLTDGGNAYVAYNPGNSNEYYLFEVRSATGFDAELDGFGLLITHIDYSSSIWSMNIVNTLSGTGFYVNSHERYGIVAADNSYVYSASNRAKDVFPIEGNNHIDNNSIPGFSTYNINRDGTYYMNLSLTNITRNDDGTVTFHFYPAGTDPNHGNRPEGATFYESFDYCAGAGGNDGLWGSGAGTGTLNPDNAGWDGNSLHGAYECAMFGSNSQAANVYTPEFTVSEESVITFLAAPYEAVVPGKIELSVNTGNLTLSTESIELPQGQWTEFTIPLSGTGTASLRLRERSGLNRFFLDEVSVLPTRLSGITEVTATSRPIQQGVYTIDGIYVGSSTANLKQGIYIVDGKKCVIK